MSESKGSIRISAIGTVNSGKTIFLPYFTGQLEIIPPIANAMKNCGYISEETRLKLIDEWFKKHFGEKYE